MTHVVTRLPLPDLPLALGSVHHLQAEDIETLRVTFDLTTFAGQRLRAGALSYATGEGVGLWTLAEGVGFLEGLVPEFLPNFVSLMSVQSLGASVPDSPVPGEVTAAASERAPGAAVLTFTPYTLTMSLRAVTFTVGGVAYPAQRTDTWTWEAEVPWDGGALLTGLELLDGDAAFTSGLLNLFPEPLPVPDESPVYYLADRPLSLPLLPGQTLRVTVDLPVPDAFGAVVFDFTDLSGDLTNLTFAALNRDLRRAPRLVHL